MEQQYFKYYQSFVSYRKAAFPSIPAPSYTEWLRDTNLIFPSETPLSSAACSQQVPPQQQNCNMSFYNNSTEAPTELSDSIDTTQSSCDEQKKKRESWAKQQSAILVNAWKENFADLETFKQPNAWLKIKHQVDKHGPPKSLKQIKSKLRTLKESYKNAKENNNKTGASPIFSPYFHVFDEVLGTRDAVNLQHVVNIGCGDEIKSPGKVDLLNLTLQKMKLISSSFIIILFHLVSF